MAYEDDVLPGGWAVPKYAKVLFSASPGQVFLGGGGGGGFWVGLGGM